MLLTTNSSRVALVAGRSGGTGTRQQNLQQQQQQQQQQRHGSRRSTVIAHAQPARSRKATQSRTVSDAAPPSSKKQQQPSNWSEGMARIQSLMGRVQAQLQALSTLRLADNPRLAAELQDKAEQHLEMLMLLAESQQQQHIKGTDTSSSTPADLQRLLREVEQQLDLEHQALVTASAAASAASKKQRDDEANRGSSSSSTASAAQVVDTPPPPPQAAAAALKLAQQQLAAAEARVTKLQRQLSEAEAEIQSTAEELSEHRELQMTYDRQCQDLYRLRMQLQLVRTQGNDAASLAVHANKEHKQNLAWLMDAHRKELAEAHRKNTDLTHEVQQMRLKLLEQEQQLWSLGGAAAAAAAQQRAPQQQQQQSQQQQLQQAEQLKQQQQQQQQQQAAQQQQAEEAAQLQRQEEARLQLQQLQESTEQLTAEKQQLMKSLQESQREQAVLLVELQNLRSAAVAAGSSKDAESAALSEAVAAAELVLKAQLQGVEQQRDKLLSQVNDLQTSLQEAKAAAAAAAAAQAATAAQPTAAAAAAAAAGLVGGGLDAAAAIGQLKVAKVEMANLRVQLADARRELRQASGRAAAAEAELQERAATYESRLAKLQTWYNKQAAVVAQLRRGRAPKEGDVGFTNTNKFWVPQPLLFEFLKHWVAREAQLQQQEGFLGLQVQPGAAPTPDGGVDVVVSSLWENIPAWEAWSKSAAGTKQHMPGSVFQYVPQRGSFPEAFVPFRDYEEAVNAKYK